MRMFTSLYSRLAAALLVLFCVMGLLFIGFTLVSTEMYQSEIAQKLNRSLADNIVAEHPLFRDGRINQEALKPLFHTLMVINPSIELYLIDREGKILAYSAPPGKVRLEQVDLAPVHQWFSGSSAMPVLGEDPRNPGRKKAISVGRIPKTGPLEGYLYIILASEHYDTSLQKVKGSYILRMSIWVIAAGILLAVAAGFLLFRFLTRRLRRLAAAMDSLDLARPGKALPFADASRQRINDEIDRLGVTFSRMVDQIAAQMDDIRQADKLRRDLIANVSHDLRTPIATLQGYIETLLINDGNMIPDERREYLETAKNHCNRLTKLVSDLFELAKLDSKEAVPATEPVNLADLVQDVVMTFRLMAETSKIALDIKTPDHLPSVSVDIGMIERVIENLIENALHHTPEGGSVTVAMEPGSDTVCLTVSDTGCGIPEHEIPHLFDRFYKVDKSRKHRPDHSGLGLAITKRILDLHAGTIRVDSEMNRGTSVCVCLPRSTTPA